VAVITVSAVVDVPVHIWVMEIGRVIAAMAIGALEDGIIIRVGVARRAHTVGVAVIDREIRVLRVVERGAGPSRRGMARRARGWEELRLRRVAWIGRVVVIGLMATDAGNWQRRVVAVDVAERTGRGRMRAGQRECGVVVVERGIGPRGRVMAKFAGLRESGGYVIGIRSALEVLQMAGHAGRTVQRVVVADVAVGAEPRWHGVQAGQCEARGRVIKRAIGPEVGVVAVLAGGRESSGCVGHRGGRIVVIGLVARDAGCVRNRVIVVDVAIRACARWHHVIAG